MYTLNKKNIRLEAVISPFTKSIEFLLTHRGNDGVESVATRFELVQIPNDSGERIEPTFGMSIANAQTLMDDLWRCGLRPTEGTGSAGAMAAVQAHLEDMRALVFRGPTNTHAVVSKTNSDNGK